MVRFRLSIGKDSRIAPGHILRAICRKTGLPGKEFSKIEIGEHQRFVDVPRKAAWQIMKQAKQVSVNGHLATVQKVGMVQEG